jgi:GTP-binding protein
MMKADKIRNVAIVAHIDHGKTTLIDSIFRCMHVFRDNQHMPERVMDNNELERERGITIRAKHCTVEWNDYLINIIDTPGHADFSGEVERVLSMVDSVLLLVDANEGPKPQTRYVLMRALKLGLCPIVIINKVDRPNADPEGALNKTFDLFLELGATDAQGDFPVLFGSGLDGWLVRHLDRDPHEGLTALFETIVENVPPPAVDQDGPFLMQISTLAWSDYLGQIGCGRVLRGRLRRGDPFQRTVTRWRVPGDREAGWEPVGTTIEKAEHMWETRGLQRAEVEEISAGDILWIAGPEEINIGDTFSTLNSPDAALPPLEIEEPTVSMFFHNNSGPFAGNDGNAVSLNVIRERLRRELRTNVALRVEESDRFTGIKVSGRGELHLGILIEEMRREGLELCVSRPEVILHKDEKGNTLEPMEQVVIDVPIEYQGTVIEKLSQRKGEMTHMEPLGLGTVRITEEAPTRGLIGYRSAFLTDTRGLGIMVSRFIGYGPWRGEVIGRSRGSLVSMETGIATAYQIEKLQERTVLFVEPNDRVYEGQVVGENSRQTDLPCNPTRRKELTNHRAANKQIDTGILSAARKMTLDQALEWISDDELVEVTPKAVRVRKMILNELERRRTQSRGQLVEAAR